LDRRHLPLARRVSDIAQSLAQAPDEIIATMKVRACGRGGAGFDRAEVVVRAAGGWQLHYLVVNADESEPGACKRHPLMLANPQA
jgi:NADH-quinone oxidoreductase subunit F